MDALAVAGQHQQRVRAGRGGTTRRVETGHIDRGGGHPVLELPLAHDRAGRPLHGGARLVERPAHRLAHRQPRQPVRVQPHRHVPHRVGRVQIRRARRAIGDALHCDRAEHGRQSPSVARFHPGAHDPVRADHAVAAQLADRSQIRMVPHQLPHQLPTTLQQPVLHPVVRHRCGVAARPARRPHPRKPHATPRNRSHPRNLTPGSFSSLPTSAIQQPTRKSLLHAETTRPQPNSHANPRSKPSRQPAAATHALTPAEPHPVRTAWLQAMSYGIS